MMWKIQNRLRWWLNAKTWRWRQTWVCHEIRLMSYVHGVYHLKGVSDYDLKIRIGIAAPLLADLKALNESAEAFRERANL